MVSKIITVLFAINAISAANGFTHSKLRVLEPILKCYEENAPEFAGVKEVAARLNLDSGADDLKFSCLVVKVCSQTKRMDFYFQRKYGCQLYKQMETTLTG